MRRFYIIQDEVKDDKGGGGGTSAIDAIIPATTGDLDDYGYGKTPEAAQNAAGKEAPVDGKESKDAGKKEAEKLPNEKEEIKDPATGYGAEPVVETKKEEAAPAVEEKKIDLGYEIAIKGVDTEEANFIKEFAKNNNLGKEAAQAFANFRVSQIESQKKADDDFKKERERLVTETKSNWYKELKSDPTFGGDKFAHNIARAEKVLDVLMTDTKKELTARGSMLPPYVMRDLAKIADRFFASENLVQGEQNSTDDNAKEKESSPLDFYI